MRTGVCLKSKYPIFAAAGLGGLLTVVNLASAQSWTATSMPFGRWTSVAVSADGIKIVAAGRAVCNMDSFCRLPIYISSHSGTSWTPSASPSNYWSFVACSADGTKLVAASGGRYFGEFLSDSYGPLYVSSDSGVTWTETSAPFEWWTAIASSADGSKLVAASGDYGSSMIYVSRNGGITWAETTVPPWGWSSLASSADGTKLVAVSPGRGPNYGPIYTSADSGVTWTFTSAPANRWVSVATSTDGTKIVAAARDDEGRPGSIYTSTDSGMTWAQTALPQLNWTSVASSADGRKLVAASRSPVGEAAIYTSTDSGITWTGFPIQADVFSVASSADGSKVVAGGNGIYTSASPPSPRLSFSSLTSTLGLSWLVPSTRFVLQESTDLATPQWTAVPVSPMLNFTNLHYEVPLSPALGNRFYRLSQD